MRPTAALGSLPRPRRWSALTAALIALLVVSCADPGREEAIMGTHGDPAQGRIAIERYGCTGCHTIPGVTGYDALVGPPLDHVRKQAYIAGVLTNTPDNLIRWIQHPTRVDSLTAMPDLGVTSAEARDIAAYLYSR